MIARRSLVVCALVFFVLAPACSSGSSGRVEATGTPSSMSSVASTTTLFDRRSEPIDGEALATLGDGWRLVGGQLDNAPLLYSDVAIEGLGESEPWTLVPVPLVVTFAAGGSATVTTDCPTYVGRLRSGRAAVAEGTNCGSGDAGAQLIGAVFSPDVEWGLDDGQLVARLPNGALVFRPATPIDDIFFQPDSTPADRAFVLQWLLGEGVIADPLEVVYFSQARSFAEFEQLFADRPELVDAVTPDVLPPSYRLTVRLNDEVAAELEALPEVRQVISEADRVANGG